jgi:hypothetical protein
MPIRPTSIPTNPVNKVNTADANKMKTKICQNMDRLINNWKDQSTSQNIRPNKTIDKTVPMM